MRQQMRTGIGFYLLILVIIAAAVYVSGTLDQGGQKTYNIVNFTQDLEDGDVTSVAILPNEEVPTGEVDVRKKDGSAQSFYVSDVTEVEKLIRSKDSKLADQYVMKDVQKPSWIITTLLPYLLGIIAIFFLFSFLSAQTAGQGGSNAKMMNFGKSRAQRIDPDDPNAKHFKDVAGLKEEKEELEEIVDFLADPAKYIVDKKTLHGNYFHLYNDFLGTKEMQIWPSFGNGYYVSNMEPSQLKETLEKELARKDLPSTVRKRTQALVKSLNEDNNNVVLFAKMKK